MPGRFPGESEEYRRARDELLAAEMDLRRQEEAVAARRRALPLGGAVPTDYEFDAWDDRAGTSRRVRLSELFDDGKDTLFLYSFMWVPEAQGLPFVGPCPSCTSIIDGIDGAVPHFTQLISFAVAAKTPIDEFRAHGERRGWRHARLLSAMPSRYSVDYEAEDENGYQWPLATVFTRRDRHDPPHVEQRAVVGRARRRRAGPSPRRLHVAAVGRARPDPAGRGDFETSLSY